MSFKVLARDDAGRKIQVDPASLTGANVLINDVPCESSVYVGAAVRMQPSGIAINAIADSTANANVIGVVEAKISLNVCLIRVLGVSTNIFTGLDVTKEYYLSNSIPGELTTTIPVTSGHVMLKMGQPFSNEEMLINKGQQVVRL